MRNLFNPDAPIVQTMTKIAWLLWYGCLWVFCCLPVFTVGASTAALYHMAFRMREDGDYSTLGFFRSFRDNFKKATGLWLLVLLAALVIALGYYGMLWIEAETIRAALLAPFCCLFVLWGFLVLYAFPLTAFFENSVGNTFKNALAMGIKHLRQSIYCFALAMIPAIALMVSEYWFLRFLYLWVFLYPGVAAYWITGILKPVFLQHATAEK